LLLLLLHHADYSIEAPGLRHLLGNLIHQLILFFNLSVHRRRQVLLLQVQLIKWLFEFSQNFVNLTQVNLIAKSRPNFSQKGVPDLLHFADLIAMITQVSLIVHLHLVLMDVVVGVLQDRANGRNGQT